MPIWLARLIRPVHSTRHALDSNNRISASSTVRACINGSLFQPPSSIRNCGQRNPRCELKAAPCFHSNHIMRNPKLVQGLHEPWCCFRVGFLRPELYWIANTVGANLNSTQGQQFILDKVRYGTLQHFGRQKNMQPHRNFAKRVNEARARGSHQDVKMKQNEPPL